ncbi:MAG: response regulator [Gemmatimonadales bacterium]|nr:response regulator [Gemmatimonadales bacterium]
MPASDPPVRFLVVDDEEGIRHTLRKFLSREGYEVSIAASGAEALDVLRRQKTAGMLLDVNLPDISGIDLVPRVLDLEPDLALLMLTGVHDAASAALCMQRGALDYLVKPVDLAHLARAMQGALRRRATLLETHLRDQHLHGEVARSAAERRMKQANHDRISTATLDALVNALEAKDFCLRGHSARVADLAGAVAAELCQSDDEIEAVRTGARLHDIGKIGIREDVLNKQGPLTDEEYGHVKSHVVVGSQILAPLTHLKEVIAFVRNHHERWDGFGYPDRLAGEAIPLGARIIGTVEIYDALITTRPYQETMSPAAAVERLRELIGTMLDPMVHEALARVIQRRTAAERSDAGEPPAGIET